MEAPGIAPEMWRDELGRARFRPSEGFIEYWRDQLQLTPVSDYILQHIETMLPQPHEGHDLLTCDECNRWAFHVLQERDNLMREIDPNWRRIEAARWVQNRTEQAR
ncbi:MAG TPA: hypothetical protein VIN09_04925 [Chloroflexota bacterium]